MSAFNVKLPPQTYSRLFRPWDCNTSNQSPVNPEKSSEKISTKKSAVKSEIQAQADDSNCAIKPTDNLCYSERECNSSNSSVTKSPSVEDGYSNNITTEWPLSPSNITNNLLYAVPYPNTNLYGSFENHAPPHLAAYYPHLMPAITSAPAASDFYYAATAAAAANGTAPSTSAAAAAAAAAYALDTYGIGLMEQEYARVMTEDAQIKAANARKQRPKKFKCPHCDVAFSNNGQLKGHIRIHTGERPFKCDVETCGKTFTRNEELTRHKRIHTGLKPYPCSVCAKKFGRRDHLKKHMKIHMPQDRQFRAAFYVPVYPTAKPNGSWSSYFSTFMATKYPEGTNHR